MFQQLFRLSLLISVIMADASGSEPLSNQTATSTTRTTTRSQMITKRNYTQPSSNGSCASPDDFLCQSKEETCIPWSRICDGVEDCPGSSDEVNCTHNGTTKFNVMFYHPMNRSNDTGNCSLHEFRCFYDGRCVNRSWRCDGRNDCGDWSDERYCDEGDEDDDDDDDGEGGKYSPIPPLSSNNVSLNHHFQNSDLKYCNLNEFKCLNRNTCIAINLTCDGWNHCGDWSDEKFCGDHLFDNNSNNRSNDKRWRKGPACNNETEFTCNSTGSCIPQVLRCNNNNDCPDDSDEQDCGKRPTIPVESYFQFIYPINGTKQTTCNSSTEFYCVVGDVCVSMEKVCDGRKDCENGGDERDCEGAERKETKKKDVKVNKDKVDQNKRGSEKTTSMKPK